MAGEWELIGDNAEHDGLRQLFLFFVDNRDVSDDGKNGGMKVKCLSKSTCCMFLWFITCIVLRAKLALIL